jgi:hypothetical protein
MEPEPDDTVTWLRLTFEDLEGVTPGSALAKKIMYATISYESAWRPAYINAVERIIINPDLLVHSDTVISTPTMVDGEDGAYVMCWQFIPHKAVIPPEEDTAAQIGESLSRLRLLAEKLDI